MNILLTPEALANDPSWTIFDCRFSLADKDAGQRDYAAGHIPGARFVDLERDMSDPPGAGGRHPLPDRERFAARMRELGLRRDSKVVCYDQNAAAVAGRLWWQLRWLGHPEVRLLDGGLDAWIAAGFETTTATEPLQPGDFAARAPLTRLRDVSELPDPAIHLLDAREPARYRGEAEPIDPVAGHIPGAISAPFADNLDGGRFRSPDELKQRFAALGIEPDIDTVCYCGSGVTATHNIAALLLAGFPEPALYAGSWSEWVADPARPVATA